MNWLEFEYILIDDGSTDKTLERFKQLAAIDQSVKYVSFSRNFGKESAIFAGLQKSTGDYIVLMDADLQDPPQLLIEMYKILNDKKLDCVGTKRVDRKGEPIIRSFFARRFYKLINRISDTEFVDGARDYRLMTRQMVDSILLLSEKNRFSKGLFSWVGYKTHWIEFENVERVAGQTKWSFWGLLKYSIEGIIGFSIVPLYISSVLGFLMCFVSILGILIVLIRHFMGIQSAFGWSSMIIVILFLSGIQLFCIGILGQYLAKTYMETKNRPIYIEKENNFAKNEIDPAIPESCNT